MSNTLYTLLILVGVSLGTFAQAEPYILPESWPFEVPNPIGWFQSETVKCEITCEFDFVRDGEPWHAEWGATTSGRGSYYSEAVDDCCSKAIEKLVMNVSAAYGPKIGAACRSDATEYHGSYIPRYNRSCSALR